MKQIITGRGLTSNEASGATIYVGLFGQAEGFFVVSRNAPWSTEGTFRNWMFQLDDAPGVGRTTTCTLQVNEADTALTFAIADLATTGSDTTHSATINPGDRVRIKIVYTGAGNTAQSWFDTCMEFEGDNARESGYNMPHSNVTSTWGAASAWYTALGFGESGNSMSWNKSVADGGVVPERYESLAPIAGDITRYDIIHQNATVLAGTPTVPVLPQGWTFYIYKNNIKQDGTGGTVDTASTLNSASSSTSWTGTLPVAEGDVLRMSAETIGSELLQSSLSIGVRFRATTDGEYAIAVRSRITTTLDRFASVSNISGWGSSELDQAMITGPTTFWVKELIHKTIDAASPGTGITSTVVFRLNLATPTYAQRVGVVDAGVLTQSQIYALKMTTIDPGGNWVEVVSGDTWDLMSSISVSSDESLEGNEGGEEEEPTTAIWRLDVGGAGSGSGTGGEGGEGGGDDSGDSADGAADDNGEVYRASLITRPFTPTTIMNRLNVSSAFLAVRGALDVGLTVSLIEDLRIIRDVTTLDLTPVGLEATDVLRRIDELSVRGMTVVQVKFSDADVVTPEGRWNLHRFEMRTTVDEKGS